ncbi:MAG: DUF3168 domain-containing protein [Siculibacillus sp.]|nr:DUF3168 domain-containing protein [Siculibacillus sp.]
MTAALALQMAVLERLRDDPAVAASPLAGRIHDAAPRDAAFPHLVVDEAVSRDRSGLDAPLAEHRLSLRLFSRKGGRREVAALAGLIETALEASDLALGGHRLVLLRRDATELRLRRDRLTAEAVLRFVALTEPL